MNYNTLVGGGLGECCLCGETFLKDLILGKNIKSVNVDGFTGSQMYAHIDCIDKYVKDEVTFLDLPDKSILKRLVLEQGERHKIDNECSECKVGLNKDGNCPSCEQDHAQKAYEDEQAGIAESAMAEQAAEEAGRYESKKEGA